MAEPEVRGTGFGAFLDAANRIGLGQANVGATSSGTATLRMLSILPPTGTLPVTEVFKQTGMDFSQFADVLSQLTETGLVAAGGVGAQQEISLTKLGEQIRLLP